MESDSDNGELLFRTLQARLLAFVNARIQNGEFSERSLAKRLGISQPHLHHVLNGDRKFETAFADVVLARFQISVLDLLTSAELTAALERIASGEVRVRFYSSGNVESKGSQDRTRRIRHLRRNPSGGGDAPPN